MSCCKDCIYWKDGLLNPVCRRYPNYEIHKYSDWCGEFKLEPSASGHVTKTQVQAEPVQAKPKPKPKPKARRK